MLFERTIKLKDNGVSYVRLAGIIGRGHFR